MSYDVYTREANYYIKDTGHSHAEIGHQDWNVQCTRLNVSWMRFCFDIISWHLETRREHDIKDELRTQMTFGHSIQ